LSAYWLPFSLAVTRFLFWL